MSSLSNVHTHARHAKRPKFLEVKEHLLGQISCGDITSGQRLPKERDLAISLGVAIGTLRQALGELETEGVIRRIRGKGTFVNTPQQRRARVQVDLFALIVPQVREALYPSLVHGFEEAVAGIQHQVTIGNSQNELSRQEQLVRQALNNNVAGVAIVPTTYPPTPAEQIRPLREHHIPVVFCHRLVEGVTGPLVTWSGSRVGRLVAEALLEKGHQRITTLIAHRDAKSLSVSRGIRQTLSDFGSDESNYRICYYGERLPGAFARDAIREALEELLGAENRPTAIYCGNLPDAEQVYLLADELGFKIPDDLSLIYFGGKWRDGVLAQRLACVAVDERRLGMEAGKLLAEMCSGQVPHDSDRRIEVPLVFLPGETVGPPSPGGRREWRQKGTAVAVAGVHD